MNVNQWFLSLPPERRAILREDKWMLAEAVARAATALESEACAQVCDALYDAPGLACYDHPTADDAARAIRKRAALRGQP